MTVLGWEVTGIYATLMVFAFLAGWLVAKYL